MDRLEEGLRDLESLVERQGEVTERSLRTALRFQGMVRYDAYRDMGGSQSWSIALLDGNQSGAVVTSLHARDHARVYLKELVEGTPGQRLSPEEERAAPLGPGRPAPPPPTAARRRAAARATTGSATGESTRRPTRSPPREGRLPRPAGDVLRGGAARAARHRRRAGGGALPHGGRLLPRRARGRGARALVPIENTIEGSVNQTLDQLAAGGGVLDPRRGGAAGAPPPARRRPWSSSARSTRVLSHPHATAQCQEFLRANLPGAEIVAANSTADAVRTGGRAARSPGGAAIGTLRAADALRLRGDRARHRGRPEDNSTRFVLLGTEPAEAVGSGRFRTSIICAPGARPPGRAPGDPPGVRHAGGQPHQAREPPDQDRARPLHVLHRHRGQPSSATCRSRRRSPPWRSRASPVSHSWGPTAPVAERARIPAGSG